MLCNDRENRRTQSSNQKKEEKKSCAHARAPKASGKKRHTSISVDTRARALAHPHPHARAFADWWSLPGQLFLQRLRTCCSRIVVHQLRHLWKERKKKGGKWARGNLAHVDELVMRAIGCPQRRGFLCLGSQTSNWPIHSSTREKMRHYALYLESMKVSGAYNSWHF